jgi:hypothetical protein
MNAMRRRTSLTAAALAAYAAFVLVVTLSPRMPGTGFVGRLVNGVLDALHAQGLFLAVDYSVVEFTANIGMFIPLGVLAALVVRSHWIVVAGTLFSGFIELFQANILPTRVGEWRDVLSNSLGFLLGVTLVWMMGSWRSARSQQKTPKPS